MHFWMVAVGMGVAAVSAVETGAPAPDAAELARLQGQVEALQSRLWELEARQASSASRLLESDTAAPTITLGLMGHAEQETVVAQPRALAAPQDVGNSFITGALVLYATANPVDRFRFFTEAALEHNAHQELVMDVERLLVSYEFAPWLKLSVGRGHTALGYWNQRFHHGVWLQTTAQRPMMYQFEDDHGVLPVHFVGLEANGKFSWDLLDLEYTANLANGRAALSEVVQNIKDENLTKAVNVMLEARPQSFLRGVVLGAHIYLDDVPPPGEHAPHASMAEAIWGAYAVYAAHHVELLGEFSVIHHKLGQDWRHHFAGYTQAAFQVGPIKPYVRVDALALPDAWGGAQDPYFPTQEGFESSLRGTAGVRWDWLSMSAVKVEARRLDSPSQHTNTLAVQLSFTL